MSRHTLLSTAILFACSLARMSAANIVTNGSFEQGILGI
jgi:hypothetical protein